jgi:hypothetical protein
VKKTSRQGQRAEGTRLISFNVPAETKAELLRIADEFYSSTPFRGRLSRLMQEIAGDTIREYKSAAASKPHQPKGCTTAA